ncbi:NUDIX hydrolase [Leptolyngbya ohadii]|uniref:NUDIX hydrolase n=1 Tax=Leptolyngbya ohadii TaxID=1962290 RepID=UPI000B59EF4A|nr:NUDIX domain-containing protein [Leptolyngbya ohadii]
MTILIHVSVAIQSENRVLLVQETKPQHHGCWNLPGGHVEFGETLYQAALREVAEETRLTIALSHLVGVYTGIRKPDSHAIRFVFAATPQNTSAIAGADILAVRWFDLDECLELEPSQLVSPAILRRIINDLKQNRAYPLEVLIEPD